jgi:hypothetical protein
LASQASGASARRWSQNGTKAFWTSCSNWRAQQREQQRAEIDALVRRLAKAGRLRPGLSHGRATATLHMLTSLESFVWLTRNYGLSVRQARETLTGLARTLLRD